ncbi:MAG: hypothetical protein KGY74_11250 [Candidatus Cloacimonetes bacterium]|nr:hypothetical protein [Candidatus Cloacimonadota bacterium]
MTNKNIKQFLHDRSSGASSLVNQELKIIKQLLQNESSEKDIKKFIQKASNKFPEMAPIKKIEFFFSNNKINVKNLEELSREFSDNEFINLSKFLFSNNKSILTFSNSSSVRKVLINFSDKLKKVYCCRSLPLAEGKVFYRKLKKKKINAELIEDMEITKYDKKIDIILIGADAIGEKYFINKVGTKILALFAKDFEIPIYVVSSRLKLFSGSEFKKLKIGKYFEKVEKKHITKFIF